MQGMDTRIAQINRIRIRLVQGKKHGNWKRIYTDKSAYLHQLHPLQSSSKVMIVASWLNYGRPLASYRVIMCGCENSCCNQLFDLYQWIHDSTGTELGTDPCKTHVRVIQHLQSEIMW